MKSKETPNGKKGKKSSIKKPPKRGNGVSPAPSPKRKSAFEIAKHDIWKVLVFSFKIFLILLIISIFFLGINFVLAKQFHLHISEEILRIVFEGGVTKVVIKIIRLF